MENNKHLVRVGHEFAAAMSDDTPIITIAKMVSELASALDVQTARSEALAVENAALKSVIGECQGYFIAGIRNTIRPTNEGYLHMRCDTISDETPATDAYLAEVHAHDLNALISHYSAELDTHISNGGNEFDDKSIRLRNVIVGARMFREELRKGASA